MKIIAKRGFEIDIQVFGFRGKFDSEILVSFNAGGKNIKNAKAKIVRNGKIVEGLNLYELNGLIECPVSEIEDAIENLPEKVKMYRKVEKTIDADGDMIRVQKWYRDGFEVVGKMASWLDTLAVSEIEAEKADALYSEYESEREANEKKYDAGFMDDMMEEGFKQACENAGVDRFAMVGIGIESIPVEKVEATLDTISEIFIETTEQAQEFFSDWDMSFMDGEDIAEFLPVSITDRAVYGTDDGKETVLCYDFSWKSCLEKASEMGLDI